MLFYTLYWVNHHTPKGRRRRRIMCNPTNAPSRGKNRVLLVTNRIGEHNGVTGGGSLMRENLISALLAEGYGVKGFSAGRSPEPDVVDTVRGPLLPASPRNMRLIWRELRDTDFVILSGAYTPLLSIVAALARWCLGLPVLYICTTNSAKAGAEFDGWRQIVARQLFMRSDRLVATLSTRVYTRSEAHKVNLCSEIGVRSPIHGVMVQNDQYRHFFRPDLTSADERATIAAARERLSSGQPDAPLLLFAGRLAPEKRLELLVAAKPPGCVLAILGGGEPAQKTAARALHDPARGVIVHADGVLQTELRTLFWAADVHVSASDFETLGNTVHEALLCGTPVVVQDAGGYQSQVAGVHQGALVDYADPRAVAVAIDRVLSANKANMPYHPVARIGTTEGRKIVCDMLLERANERSRANKMIAVDQTGAAEADGLDGGGGGLALWLSYPPHVFFGLLVHALIMLVLDPLYIYCVACGAASAAAAS